MTARNQTTDTLTDRQRRLIAALLAESTVEKAALAVGVGRRTAWTWLHDPRFREAYTAASRDRLAEAVGKLRGIASEAVEALRAALEDPAASIRVRAAQVLLDAAIKADFDELARRVEALEAAQQKEEIVDDPFVTPARLEDRQEPRR